MLPDALFAIESLNGDAMAAMQIKLDSLLKPPTSLGRLESLAVQLAGISGHINIKYPEKRILVFAADHGVFDEGVAITPQSVTQIQAVNMVNGLTGVCAIAKSVKSQVIVTDVGIKSPPLQGVINKKIRQGCSNITKGPAMSHQEAEQALKIGFEIAQQVIEQGANIIAVGELGIANTTPASAIISVLCRVAPEDVVGLGANLPESRLQHKINVVKNAIAINNPAPDDAIDVLAKVGGFEFGSMAGAMLACAKMRIPVVLDGFLSYAAALLAYQLSSPVRQYFIPSHYSAEKGSLVALDKLNLKPYFDMELRLGEGSGAALAFPVIDAACSIVSEMGTLNDFNIVLPT